MVDVNAPMQNETAISTVRARYSSSSAARACDSRLRCRYQRELAVTAKVRSRCPVWSKSSS